MNCKKCGNELDEYMFCVNCKLKNEVVECNDSDTKSDLNDILVFILYLISSLLSAVLIFINLNKIGAFADKNMFFAPLIVFYSLFSFLWPNLYGVVLSFRNLKSRRSNGWLLLLIVGIVCLAISFKLVNEVIVFDSFLNYIVILVNVLLIMVIFLKTFLTFKNK